MAGATSYRPPTSSDIVGDRRKPTKGERQRQAIVDALRELLIEHPFDELTIGQIADRAGVTRQGFYLYFDSKSAALTIAVLEASAELDHTIETVGPRAHGESVEEFLRRLLSAGMVTNEHQRGVIAAGLQASSQNPQLAEFIRDRLRTNANRTIGILLADRDNPPTVADLPSTMQILGGMAAVNGPFLELVMPDNPEHGMDALVGIWKHALWPTESAS